MPRSVGLSATTIAICLVVVIANLGNNIVAPVLPSIRDYFGSSAAAVSLMASGFGLGRLVMDMPAGLLTDRFSAKSLFAAGIVVSGLASALAAFSTSLEGLIVFRTIMGFGSTIMTTVGLVVLVNAARPHERGKVLAFYSSAGLLGSSLSPIIGGYLATLFTWRAVFVFCALTPFVSFPLNLVITDRGAERPEPRVPGRKPAFGPKGPRVGRFDGSEGVRTNWPALVTVYFTSCVNFFARQGMQAAVLPLYAGAILGLDSVSIGGILSSRAIFTILIMLPAGALADRIGRKQLLIPGMLLSVAGNLYLLTGDSVFIFAAATFLISLGILGNNMISALVADLVPERRLGRGMGMYRFTCDLGVVLGPFALGLIVDSFGYAAASVAAAAVTLVALAACALFVPRRTSPLPVRSPQPEVDG